MPTAIKVPVRYCLDRLAKGKTITIVTKLHDDPKLRGSETYKVSSVDGRPVDEHDTRPAPDRALTMIRLNGRSVSQIDNPAMRYLGAQSEADYTDGQRIDPENVGYIVEGLLLVMELASGRLFCSYGPACEISIC